MKDKVDMFFKSIIFFSLSYCSIGACDIVGGIINCYRNRSVIKNSEIINDFNDTEIIFNEEKKKLGLEDLDLDFVITDNIDSPGNLTISLDKYLVNIDSTLMSREIIRHELYHLYRWKNGSRYFSLPILCQYEEYLATSYSIEQKEQ